ncbi:MAG: hypothetical protein CVU46_10600 [Chloroflexi bacterium HGW-Chloroflexi-8]|jgi:hypothetical protein|nr:MAG: hypothetical protein CVU46_10600 [Chloroflexi bacterium HGW-Chloroflexi-8]
MDQTIPELTKKYIGEKTLDVFADGLGVEIKKQSVSQWANGIHNPSMETLLSVLASPEAEGWAKSWAGECFAALQRQAMSLSVK